MVSLLILIHMGLAANYRRLAGFSLGAHFLEGCPGSRLIYPWYCLRIGDNLSPEPEGQEGIVVAVMAFKPAPKYLSAAVNRALMQRADIAVLYDVTESSDPEARSVALSLLSEQGGSEDMRIYRRFPTGSLQFSPPPSPMG